MSMLFSHLTIRNIKLKNRIFVSPMCQYSSNEGMPNDWHMVHLGSRAVGGAALVMTEAAAVSPEGRISPDDLGIWSEKHAAALKPVTNFIKKQGSVPAIQLAHAGRKASTKVPWEGQGEDKERGWQTIAPTSVPFSENYPVPVSASIHDLERITGDFAAAANFSLKAGFQIAEIHMAHGYLLHQFLSPLSNKRTDNYGGSFENRTRFPLQIAEAVRAVWPDDLPLFVRISSTDWTEGGWDINQSVEFSRKLKTIGIDLIDCSSGGIIPGVKIPLKPGYQVQFSEAIKTRAEIKTGAVGLITEPAQAEEIISSGKADAVLLARELLRDPYWPLKAAHQLGIDIKWPVQYKRAKPSE